MLLGEVLFWKTGPVTASICQQNLYRTRQLVLLKDLVHFKKVVNGNDANRRRQQAQKAECILYDSSDCGNTRDGF
jgi:hypothetical protein